MHEQDFKQALRDTMSVVTAPPPMSETMLLDAAKRAHRRQRAMWASGASAAAVVALAVGVAFAAPGTGRSGPNVGATSTTDVTSPSDTRTSWPDGQTDRTARSGPRYEKGVTLLNDLVELVPPDLETPDLVYSAPPELAGQPLRHNQSQFSDRVDGVDVWEYMAGLPVARAGQVGKLVVLVNTPRSYYHDKQGCALAKALWSEGDKVEASCQEVTVGDKKVTVATAVSDYRYFDQWAAYHYSDGTVVFVAQNLGFPESGQPAMSTPPLTPEQLAELATNSRFHLD